MKRVLLAGILCLGLLFAAGLAAAAQTVSAGSDSVDVGDTVEIPVVYDQAPQGLAGYKMTVSLSNGALADIETVNFVAFAGATKVEISADKNRVTFQAADFGQAVEPAATDVTLAKVVLKGIAGGESAIQVQLNRFDADGGADLLPTTGTEDGTLTVEGGPSEDVIPPQFPSKQPPDGSTISSDQPAISIDITDDQSGVDPDTIQLMVTDGAGSQTFDRQSPGADWDGLTFSIDLAAAEITLVEGLVSVEAQAADQAGNSRETSWSFTILIVSGAPQVSLTEPSPNATVTTADVTFSFTIADDLDDQIDFELIIDGDVVVEDIARSGVQQTEMVSGLTDGGHIWQVRAADSEGNVTTSGQRRFTVRTGAALSVEQAVAGHSGDPGIIEDEDILWAVGLWIIGEPVPGTGGQIIDDPVILRMVELWIIGEPVS